MVELKNFPREGRFKQPFFVGPRQTLCCHYSDMCKWEGKKLTKHSQAVRFVCDDACSQLPNVYTLSIGRFVDKYIFGIEDVQRVTVESTFVIDDENLVF